MAFAKTLKERKLTIYCDYCFRNITLDTYFRCEECRFDSCLICFFTGIETEQHKLSHSFRIVSELSKSLFSEEWRLIDELLLIDGMITYGFGNFDDVSKILAPKTESEIRKHFYELIKVKDSTEGEVIRTETLKSNPNDSYVLSYMSKRHEFDSEILNEYETNIELLRFEEDDTPLETEYKRHMLYNYKNILKRRHIWRNFVFDRNLIDAKELISKFTSNSSSNNNVNVGELASKYKWLLQFLSKHDFNVFIAGLIKEKELKSTILNFPSISIIDENKLSDSSKLLNSKEKEICNKIKLSMANYIKIKKMALEYFVCKKPLKEAFIDLFPEEDRGRAMVLYRWFQDQNIIIEE